MSTDVIGPRFTFMTSAMHAEGILRAIGLIGPQRQLLLEAIDAIDSMHVRDTLPAYMRMDDATNWQERLHNMMARVLRPDVSWEIKWPVCEFRSNRLDAAPFAAFSCKIERAFRLCVEPGLFGLSETFNESTERLKALTKLRSLGFGCVEFLKVIHGYEGDCDVWITGMDGELTRRYSLRKALTCGQNHLMQVALSHANDASYLMSATAAYRVAL